MNITGASATTNSINTNVVMSTNSTAQLLIKNIVGTYTILRTIPAIPRPGTGQVYPRYT